MKADGHFLPVFKIAPVFVQFLKDEKNISYCVWIAV